MLNEDSSVSLHTSRTEISVSSHSFSWGKIFETDNTYFLFQSHIIMFFCLFVCNYLYSLRERTGPNTTFEKEDNKKQYNSLLDRRENEN